MILQRITERVISASGASQRKYYLLQEFNLSNLKDALASANLRYLLRDSLSYMNINTVAIRCTSWTEQRHTYSLNTGA